jgi:monoamine oxidase
MRVTDWSGSRFTRGGYARLAARTLAADIAQLGQSHGPRVHFAGEATSPTRYGYVDGAYQSGVECADAILRLRA